MMKLHTEKKATKSYGQHATQAGRRLAGLLAIVLIACLLVPGRTAMAAGAVSESALSGLVQFKVSGSYYNVSDSKIIKRLNQIRKEACSKGYPDPRDPSRSLTMDDYRPVSWSDGLYTLAQVRAIEACLVFGHDRPSGLGRDLNSGECLAWNQVSGGPLMYGIEQWYGEKNLYRKTKAWSSGTGHYILLIHPEYTYIGVSCFKASGGDYYTTAANMSDQPGAASDVVTCDGKKVWIDPGRATSLSLTSSAKSIWAGNTLSLSAKTKLANSRYTAHKAGKITSGGSWSSSDPTVATVDETGTVTGVGGGKATISLTVGSKTVTKSITVKAPVAATPASNSVSVTAKVDGTETTFDLITDYVNAIEKAEAKKSPKKNGLSADSNISAITDLYPGAADAIKISYYNKNNTKVFVNTATKKKQPYFYIQLKLDEKKAKAADLTSKQIKELKKIIEKSNSKLKGMKNYYYINPNTGD